MVSKAQIMLMVLILFTTTTLGASDWPSWRGPTQDGSSMATGLISEWSAADGKNLIWKAPIIGRSTPILMNGRVYVNGRIGQGVTMQEHVACFDAKDGKLIWQHRFSVYLTTVPFNRVGWPSLAGDPETGNVYARGVGGILIGYDKDGKILWSHSLTEEFGHLSGYGGRTDTPIIDEGLLIVGFSSAAWGDLSAPRNRYYAFDKRTGDIVWISTPGGMPYDFSSHSTPVVATINGQRLLIAGNGDGNIYAMKVRTGEKVWGFSLSKRGVNSAVVVSGHRVYASHSEENIDEPTMGRVVCIDGSGSGDITKTGEVWRANNLEIGYASPAIHAGRLYVIDNSANVMSMDAESGKIYWKQSVGTVGKGSPVWADGKLYVTEVNGSFHILQPTDTGAKILDSEIIDIPKENRKAELYGSPAIAYGRIYFTTEEGLYCLGSKGKFSKEPLPAKTAVAPPPAGEPASVQLVPAEILISPAETPVLRARLFDAKGNFVREEKATWTLTGLKGTVDDAGKFSPDTATPNQAGYVSAKVGALEGKSRIRIVSDLPWNFDFESIPVDKAPAYWVGVGTRFLVKDKDGNKVLAKPIVQSGLSSADIYLGPALMNRYTIQADVMGTRNKRKMPDVGLIVHGYTLDLMGNHQRLQLRSWTSMLRIKQEMNFSWEPDVWYTMKMRFDIEGGRGLIRGKVWKKGEPEPDAWTITAEDPLPIANGTPGLYGNSAAEIYYDNVTVIKNE